MTSTPLLLALAVMATTALGSRLPYIIGGKVVDDNTKYPWQGSLMYDGSHSCGCALISDTWVVTAGHCVGWFKSPYSIRFGSVLWNTGGIVRDAEKIIRHEDYEKGDGGVPNDIALIQISSVDQSNSVKAIALASEDQAGNSECYVTGWGYTKTGWFPGDLPDELNEANINVYTNAECKKEWGNDIIAGHVCIGADGKGSCNGDSGGPLVCKVNGKYELVGVTSWGVAYCYTSSPSVYTRISYYQDWIKEKSGV